MPAGLVDRFGDRPRLGDDLEALAPVEQRGKALADDLVIVDDQQAQDVGRWLTRSCGWLLGLVGGEIGTRIRSDVPFPG